MLDKRGKCKTRTGMTKSIPPKILRSFVRQPNPVLADIKSIYNRHETAAAGFTVFRF